MRVCPYLLIFAVFINCQKDAESDPYYTDLHNTLIYIEWANLGVDYNLDIDNDSKTDVILTAYSYYSKMFMSENYFKITPVNGFEIAYSDYITKTWNWNPIKDTVYYVDTVMIPDVFDIGDTIKVEDHFSQSPVMLFYDMQPDSPGKSYSSGISYGIPAKKGYYFMAFRNKSGNKNKLAWLKVEGPLSNNGIILNSCKCTDNESFFVIK